MPLEGERRWWIFAALAAIAAIAYLPAQLLPFISDDYGQIRLAREFGPVSGWDDLAADALYRCRATSLVLTYWTERIFGLSPLVFHLSSLLLHILNTFLVVALGAWKPVGWRVSIPAAAVFAAREGHQEAVIWYAALPELLVFFFSLLAFVFWVRWLQAEGRGRGAYMAAFVWFVLALLSKESAVAVVGLMLLAMALAAGKLRQRLPWFLPFPVLSIAYFLLGYAVKSTHLHYNDGTFSLAAPVLTTLTISIGRLLWFWGALALLVLLVHRHAIPWRLTAIAAAWIVVGLLPYSFLTYMPRVPSRHTYLAGVGLALLCGAALMILRENVRKAPRLLVPALAALFLIHNCTYLWTRKQHQFEERAASTEAFLAFVKANGVPVFVHCFPYGMEVAWFAAEIELGVPAAQVIWAPDPGGCAEPYKFSTAPLPHPAGMTAKLTE
ncbi:MAG: hypothetical protein HYZ57_04270 [Acidobacteria bacterium]|nr:hypothetical protein [Acidobacteriota bacterium]